MKMKKIRKIFVSQLKGRIKLDKKNILIIHTGGTISMSEDALEKVVKPTEVNPLVEKTKELENFANLIVEEPFHLPSPHITAHEMYEIREIILKHLEHIDGVVITHGTDTLEETAYFLDLTLKPIIPIVLTGAMRSSNEIGSDGLYNFISAIRVALSEEAKDKGVLVVLNDEIHTAVNVTKTSTSNLNTFQSPQYGPIGIVTKRSILFHHAPTIHEHYELNSISKRAVILKAFAGMDSTLLDAILNSNFDGVIIEALGQGNLPPKTIPGIKNLIAANIPVVLVSRCFNGIAEHVYSYEGGGAHLKELGVIFAHGLNGQKARLKLLVLLENNFSKEEIEKLFD